MKTKFLSIPPSGVSLAQVEFEAKDDHGLVACHRLLVPIDFSEHSRKTLEYATQLATFTGASIRILHVCQIPEHPAAFYHGLHIGNDLVNSLVEMATGAATVQLSLVTDEIVAKGLKAQPILRAGNPYEEIVRVAKEMRADLIVIGSHGYKGLGRFLLGSTAERVVQYAPCAVLVVKNGTGSRGAGSNQHCWSDEGGGTNGGADRK